MEELPEDESHLPIFKDLLECGLGLLFLLLHVLLFLLVLRLLLHWVDHRGSAAEASRDPGEATGQRTTSVVLIQTTPPLKEGWYHRITSLVRVELSFCVPSLLWRLSPCPSSAPPVVHFRSYDLVWIRMVLPYETPPPSIRLTRARTLNLAECAWDGDTNSNTSYCKEETVCATWPRLCALNSKGLVVQPMPRLFYEARGCLSTGFEVRPAIGALGRFKKGGFALRTLTVLTAVLGTHLRLLPAFQGVDYIHYSLRRKVLLRERTDCQTIPPQCMKRPTIHSNHRRSASWAHLRRHPGIPLQ